jgi:hypothetical protein
MKNPNEIPKASPAEPKATTAPRRSGPCRAPLPAVLKNNAPNTNKDALCYPTRPRAHLLKDGRATRSRQLEPRPLNEDHGEPRQRSPPRHPRAPRPRGDSAARALRRRPRAPLPQLRVRLSAEPRRRLHVSATFKTTTPFARVWLPSTRLGDVPVAAGGLGGRSSSSSSSSSSCPMSSGSDLGRGQRSRTFLSSSRCDSFYLSKLPFAKAEDAFKSLFLPTVGRGVRN